jgi:hypothetical protein
MCSDSRAAELDRHEAVLKVREAALADQVATVSGILSAADHRDQVSTLRDAAADARDAQVDGEEFVHPMDSSGERYGAHLRGRRESALDRRLAKSDRLSSRADRIALAEHAAQSEPD